MTKNNFDWKKYINEALLATEYCSIATVDNESGTWVNPIYFAFDKDYNLYFISQMASRHMQNIGNSPKISVAIYKTDQKAEKIGIQIDGIAKIITDKDSRKEIENAYKTYHARSGKSPNPDSYINPKWLYAKITINNMYYFDTKHFGEERQTVPLEDIR